MTSPAIHIITHDSFAATVGKPGYCILDCSATWCPPCQRFAPVFAAAAERRRDLTWGTIDTEQEPQLAAALDIRAQPTIVVLRDGAVIYKHVGALSAAKFDELIDRVTGGATGAGTDPTTAIGPVQISALLRDRQHSW